MWRVLTLARYQFPCLSTIGLFLALHASKYSVLSAASGSDSPSVGARYTEDLTLQRLGRHHVAARFVFRSQWVPQARHRCQDHEDWQGNEDDGGEALGKEGEGKLCHFDAVFPRAVGVLLDRFKVRDLSLQMSKGRWDTTAWGNGPGDGARGEYTPGGAEMWARLPSEGAWESWVGLRRSLSGLYCSSLDGMDETRVYTPTVTAMPGEFSQCSNDNTTVLRGTLPREPVCTENLIPLIKMLPCRSKTGLGSLLHPTRLFQSDYHSISVRASTNFSSAASDTSNAPPLENRSGDQVAIASLTLEQTVLAVFRPRPHLPSAVSRGKVHELPASGGGKKDVTNDEGGWSIASVLLPMQQSGPAAALSETVALEGCPVAARSAIHVLDATAGRGLTPMSPSTRCEVSDKRCDAGARAAARSGVAADGSPAARDSPNVTTRLLSSPNDGQNDGSDAESDISVSHFLRRKLWVEDRSQTPAEAVTTPIAPEGRGNEGAAEVSSAAPAVARLDHYLAGRGGTRGVSVAHLVNMHATAGAYADFLQPVPYFMVPLLGTLRARVVPSCSSAPEGDIPTSAGGSSFDAGGSATSARDGALSGRACGGQDEGGLAGVPTEPLGDLAQNVSLTPGVGRRPAVIEVRLWVPAASTLVLGFDFFKRFLTVDDFPPDPSRGFDVPPPLARFSFEEVTPAAGSAAVGCPVVEFAREGDAYAGCSSGGMSPEEPLGDRVGRVVYAYGEAGLMDTPQPDFSMPFNVITFTSTVITFFLGTAINLLVRKSASSPSKKKKGGGKGGKEQGGDNGSDDGGRAGDDGSGGGRRWLDRPRKVLRGTLDLLKRAKGKGDVAPGTRIRNNLGTRLKED